MATIYLVQPDQKSDCWVISQIASPGEDQELNRLLEAYRLISNDVAVLAIHPAGIETVVQTKLRSLAEIIQKMASLGHTIVYRRPQSMTGKLDG